MSSFVLSSKPPRTVEQFCAQHNLTLTPRIAKMSLAEVSRFYQGQTHEPGGHPPLDNRGLIVDESTEVHEPPPVTYQPDPITWQSLGGGCWVGQSTRKNLEWHRQAVYLDRFASILREDAQWAKK